MRGEENPGSPAMLLKDLDQAWMVWSVGRAGIVVQFLERSTRSEHSSQY